MGVLRGVRGFVQYAHPLASSPRGSWSSRLERGGAWVEVPLASRGDERGVFGEHAQAYLTLLDVSFTRNYVMRSKAPWMVAPLKSLLSLSSGSCGRYSRLLSQGARGGCS